MTKNRLLAFFLVLVSMLGGLYFYASMRPPTTLIHACLKDLGINLHKINRVAIPDYCQQSLPSFFWMFALVLTILLIWDLRRSPQTMIWIGLSFGVAFLLEIGQLFVWMPGTFDPMDLIFLVMGAEIAVVTGLLIGKRKTV